jgi:hypothetical protein
MTHILTAAERIIFLNDTIRDAMRKENEASKDWMMQEFTTWRFYHPECYGHDTDEKIHAYMDRAKVPKQVAAELWEAYINSVDNL